MARHKGHQWHGVFGSLSSLEQLEPSVEKEWLLGCGRGLELDCEGSWCDSLKGLDFVFQAEQ